MTLPDRSAAGRSAPAETGSASPDTPQGSGAEEIPFRNSMLPEECYESMDPGIRFAVRLLHAHGIDTYESCEGGDGHSYDLPTVAFVGEPEHAAGFAALSALAQYRLPVRSIGYQWRISHGLPAGPGVWQVKFSKPLHDMADQRPTFVRHVRYEAPT